MSVVHLLISGSDYEGGSTVSVHASLTGASEAALVFMMDRNDNKYRRIEANGEPLWRAQYQPYRVDGEGVELVAGEWQDGCDYLLIREYEVLP